MPGGSGRLTWVLACLPDQATTRGPLGVTSVGIHERSAREKISHVMNGGAHIMNDEATRKYLPGTFFQGFQGVGLGPLRVANACWRAAMLQFVPSKLMACQMYQSSAAQACQSMQTCMPCC